MYFLRVLMIALFVPGAVCGVVCNGGASGEEPEDKYWPLFEELKKETLSPERRSEILNKVIDQVWDDGRILYVAGKQARKYPRAREVVLRRLTEIIGWTREDDEGRPSRDLRLCKLFDTLLVDGLLSGDDLSRAAATEVEAVLRDAKTNPRAFLFAAPKAAALLLSVEPKHRAAQQSLSDWLQSKDSGERMRAAAALRLAGQRAEPMAAKLRPLLKDEAVEVRVMAASSLWKIDPRSPDVVGVLRKSLHEEPKGVFTRPLISAHEWVPNHIFLAITCLGDVGERAREAASDIVPWLKKGNQSVRWVAARALGTIGARTPDVLSALEAAKADANVAVSQYAEESLAALRGQQPSPDSKP
jgi:hypothetical protein